MAKKQSKKKPAAPVRAPKKKAAGKRASKKKKPAGESAPKSARKSAPKTTAKKKAAAKAGARKARAAAKAKTKTSAKRAAKRTAGKGAVAKKTSARARRSARAIAPSSPARRSPSSARGNGRAGLDGRSALALPVEELSFRTDARELEGVARARRSKRGDPVVDFQERGLESLRTGLEVDGPGYNIFVCGPAGSGRETAVRALLGRIEPPFPPAPDRVYVHSWRQPDQPHLITLPRGKANRFKRDLDELVDLLRRSLPSVFDSDAYHRRRDRIVRRWRDRERALLAKFDDELRKEGFCLGHVTDGGLARPDVMVVVGRKVLSMGQVVSRQKLGEIRVKGLPAVEARQEELTGELEGVLRKCRVAARRARRALRKVDRSATLKVVSGLFADLAERWENPDVTRFLEGLEENVLASVDVFLDREEPHPDDRNRGPEPPHDDELGLPPPRGADPFATFRANVVLDNADRPAHPIIEEIAPSYPNLFGSIEGDPGLGADFLRIKGGSLLRADGGYLVMDARDVIAETGVWRSLKRVLKHGQLEIQRFDPTLQAPISPVKPEPIDLRLKVVLVGDPETFHAFDDHDEDFRELFKVKAEFDGEVPNVKANRVRYARAVTRIANEAELRRPDAMALARLVDWSVRDSGRKNRISSRFHEAADVLREADRLAARDDARSIDEEHVVMALEDRRRRHDLGERKVAELIEDGLVLIDTQGRRTGQVNALTVYDLGDHVFGRPARVTAAVSPGRSGVVDIEHAADLAGETHHKGVLILSGFLRERWARDVPLSLAATVCFEQSYADIDGDSASAAELFAIVSALADAPVDQRLAVTGSVNQKGDIQAVGGVNEKIEGFFDTCRKRRGGLVRGQGVVIPTSNVPDLMLRGDLVEAVADGRFTVYAIDTVDQGLELLTGLTVGELDRASGAYPAGTIAARVQERLRAFATSLRDAAIPPSIEAAHRPAPAPRAPRWKR